MISKNIVSKISQILATFFYVGYFPKMPGTAASFITMLIVYLLPVLSLIQNIVILSVIFGCGVVVSGNFEKKMGTKDPSIIVIDEFAGMWLALLFTPKTIVWYLITFGLFRFFDIYKPHPIDIPDKLMTGGWGIMLDDILAGFATGVVIFMLVY